jgi:hypothetical protein
MPFDDYSCRITNRDLHIRVYISLKLTGKPLFKTNNQQIHLAGVINKRQV